ncbi:MAG: DegT/DnrJ/EryC1/StrS family aminotransferase [Chloroflexi bacterium]|nr:DegT/DnrJ/EryC1/StrS family aminotransferase [Chloroflexota bacterium]
MSEVPALLGGTPAFQSKINIVRPVLPDFSEMAEGVQSILRSGMVTKGEYLKAFEKAIREHLGVKHAIGVSSCTSGLMLTYRGLGLTGEVVVPSFTFMATVSALVWSGLRPVYADVSRGTTNLDPAAAEAAITPRTSAIVAVHNFGNPAEIDELKSVADRHGLKLIFDAAHGFGALYKGQPVGSQGDAHVFSLSPTKLLIAGEGGIVTTNDDALAEQIYLGREYGNSGNYDSAFAGLNARMPEFNALLGLRSLERLEDAAETRNQAADLYHEMLGVLPGVEFQTILDGNRCSYKDFSVVFDPDKFGLTRDELAIALAAENIDTRKYYEPPVHRQTAYAQYYDDQPLPNTEWLANNSLSFPLWSNMDSQVVVQICQAIKRIYQAREAVRNLVKQQAVV